MPPDLKAPPRKLPTCEGDNWCPHRAAQLVRENNCRRNTETSETA